jgi:hypothetical protein
MSCGHETRPGETGRSAARGSERWALSGNTWPCGDRPECGGWRRADSSAVLGSRRCRFYAGEIGRALRRWGLCCIAIKRCQRVRAAAKPGCRHYGLAVGSDWRRRRCLPIQPQRPCDKAIARYHEVVGAIRASASTIAPEHEPITVRHVVGVCGNGEIRRPARQLRGFAMRRPSPPNAAASRIHGRASRSGAAKRVSRSRPARLSPHRPHGYLPTLSIVFASKPRLTPTVRVDHSASQRVLPLARNLPALAATSPVPIAARPMTHAGVIGLAYPPRNPAPATRIREWICARCALRSSLPCLAPP